MNSLRGKPYFTRREVVSVVKWKVTTFAKRAIKYVDRNDHSSVRWATWEAFRSALPEEGVAKLIRNLNGIGVPVASAILMFQAPHRYTVIDRNAWRVLERLGLLGRKPSSFSASDYRAYLDACRNLANIHHVRLRTLDRGLWVLGTEGWEGRLRSVTHRIPAPKP